MGKNKIKNKRNATELVLNHEAYNFVPEKDKRFEIEGSEQNAQSNAAPVLHAYLQKKKSIGAWMDLHSTPV